MAVTPDPLTSTDDSVSFYWNADKITDRFYIYMYFAEVVELPVTQTRGFNIYANDNLFYGPMSPNYLLTSMVYTVSPGSGVERYHVVINKTVTSTLPPPINAVEVYKEIKQDNKKIYQLFICGVE
ncbi:putative leucine-rich repeat receptor-like protein kinase At2g19210 [Lycium ferocissimum]|uniref:putative leucine-rich repeat receptor-like protein kinase At2g19210 n=1 Tax=Lycium ferocissimum TaxID=112874 RepID=UPI0028150FAA|nr:putative leucine-rich repeat receptor-like protein kinase At2g19210 [Lycium ferocissimum]